MGANIREKSSKTSRINFRGFKFHDWHWPQCKICTMYIHKYVHAYLYLVRDVNEKERWRAKTLGSCLNSVCALLLSDLDLLVNMTVNA